MKKGLLRLRHVRRLLEERAGRELQIKAAELRRLEEAATRQRSLAAEACGDFLGQKPGRDAADAWLGMADAEIFSCRRLRMEAMAHQVSDEVAALREFRANRRIEKEQLEILVSESEREQKQERVRREQQQADEWFQNRAPSKSRGVR